MKKRFLKFQNKFFFTFICLSLIPIIALTTFTLNLYVNSQKNQTDTNSVVQLRNIDETIYEKTKNVKRFIDLVKMNTAITEQFSKVNPNLISLDKEIRNVLLSCEGIEGTIFVFPSNEYYAYNFKNLNLDTIKLQVLFNISDLHPNSFTWFDNSSDNLEVGIDADLITVGTLYEYIDYNGNPQSAKVYIFINKEFFNQILNKNFTDASVTIVDKSGSFITSNDSGFDYKLVSNDLKIMRKIHQSEENVLEFKNKINYTATVYTSSTTEFKYISIMPSKSFYKGTDFIIRVAFMIVFMFILLFVILYMFIIKKITLPIKNIAGIMKNFDDTSLGMRIPVKGNDEVSDIAKGYNKMISRFSEMIEEIKAHKDIQKETEIKALSYQINPHFLYNALSAIRIEASNNNDEKVAESILFLSKILKSVFSNTNKYITLEEELEISRYTISLLELRYNRPISYKLNYDEEIKYCRIPSMVLQPIIENCVLHGLSKKMDNESFHAKIDVTAEKESEFLKIYVIDNGVGMDDRTIKEVFEKDSSQKRGIGIFNVDERIKLLYGEDYGITIKSKPGIYTEVEMKFKFIQNG